MRSTPRRRRLRPRLLVSLAVLAAALTAGTAIAATTITTGPPTDSISSFGQDGTETYGQVFTGTGQTLTSFTLWLDLPSSVVFRPAVYGWSGSAATNQLWIGAATTTSGSGMEAMLFKLSPGAFLASGQRYVLLITVLGESGSGAGSEGTVPNTAYAGGDMVWQNSSPAAPLSQLQSTWDGIGWYPIDAAFTAVLGPAGPAPEPNIVHIGYCSVEGNTNPFSKDPIPPGTFVVLEGNQPSSDPNYKGAFPANFVQGVGITCDAPPAGYVRQGFATEDMHVPGGVYPYWVPPAS